MKKILLSVFAVIGVAISITAQNQSKFWYLDRYKVNFSSGTPTATAAFSPGGSFASNGYYDPNNNNMVVYVKDNSVYNKNNAFVGNINITSIDLFPHPSTCGYFAGQGMGTEITIVPVPLSCSRYYIIYYAYEVTDCNLTGFGLDVIPMLSYSIYDETMNNGNGGLAAVDVFIDPLSVMQGQFDDFGGFAVGKLRSNNTMFLYSALGGVFHPGKVWKYIITSTGITPASATPMVSFSTYDASNVELDLSPDGSMLAWGNGQSKNNPRDVTVLYLNPATGDYTGTMWQPSINPLANFTGVEFSPDNSKLYVGAVDNQAPWGNIGIYQLNVVSQVNNGLMLNVPASYGKSQLETSFDPSGNYKILAASSSSVIGAIMDPNFALPGPSFTLNFIPSITSATLIQNTFYSNAGSMPTVFNLPDQIDGENYNNFLNVLTPFSYSTQTFTASTSAAWTQGNNPITGFSNPSVIRIQTSLIINATISMSNMTFEFGPAATLVINNGKSLMTGGTILRGVPCNSMWQGVQVVGTGLINITNSSKIEDAIIGVDVSGQTAKMSVNTQSSFRRNETNIKLTNVNAANITVSRTTFQNIQALKDQTKGVPDATLGGLKNCIYNIQIINSNASTIVIGDISSSLNRNFFIKGQYGIHITNSNVDVKQNTFTVIQNTAIFGDGTYQNRTVNVTDNNIFNSVRTGIDLQQWISSTIQGNTFNSGTQFGIFWQDNSNRQLLIGGFTTAQKNIFNNNNWAGIMTSANAGAQTQITIIGNDFNGPWYADGIIVQEWALSSSPAYQILNNKRKHNE